MAIPRLESPDFTDLFAREERIDLKHLGGDFVVWKSAGTPAYQLAVVVDDAEMGVTEVIRGDDLIPSTPRQLLLYRALGLTPPAFAHVPFVVGEDGRRLAKRHGDTRLSALRAAGVKPESLVGLLAWSCGWIEKPEPVSARELLPLFRLDTIPRGRLCSPRRWYAGWGERRVYPVVICVRGKTAGVTRPPPTATPSRRVAPVQLRRLRVRGVA